MAEQNLMDIDLGTRTLTYLGGLKDEHIPDDLKSKMRSIVANLCEFEYRFAKPMDLPFELGKDFDDILPMERPLDPLLRFKAVYKVEGATEMAPEDGITKEDAFAPSYYCLVGRNTWKKLVAEGKLTGEDAESVRISSSLWLNDLFRLLSLGMLFEGAQRHFVRRLVSCWYYVATQLDFSEDPDNENLDEGVQVEIEGMSAFDPSALVASLTQSLVNIPNDPEDEGKNVKHEEETAEESTDASVSPKDENEKTKDKAEEDDNEDDAPPPLEPQRSLLELLNNDDEYDSEGDTAYDPTKDQDNDTSEGDYDDEVEVEDNEAIEDFLDRAIPEYQVETMKTVFATVEELGAFMPSPRDDIGWFKRVLKDIRVVQSTGDTTWYPWGVPPIVPLITILENAQDEGNEQDEFLTGTAGDIILLFQQQATGGEADGNNEAEGVKETEHQ